MTAESNSCCALDAKRFGALSFRETFTDLVQSSRLARTSCDTAWSRAAPQPRGRIRGRNPILGYPDRRRRPIRTPGGTMTRITNAPATHCLIGWPANRTLIGKLSAQADAAAANACSQVRSDCLFARAAMTATAATRTPMAWPTGIHEGMSWPVARRKPPIAPKTKPALAVARKSSRAKTKIRRTFIFRGSPATASPM